MNTDQPPNAPPWAMITPSTPSSGTSIAAVTVCDLFLMLMALFSLSRFMPGYSVWDVPSMSTGRPTRSGLKRSAERTSSGSTLNRAAWIRNRRCSSASFSGCSAARSLDWVQSSSTLYSSHESSSAVASRAQPRVLVLGHRGPAEVVDRPVAEHLEVLRLVTLRRVGVVEAVGHADALHRALRDAVHASTARGCRPPPARSGRRRCSGRTGCGSHPWPGCRWASARSCRCGCRPSARRPAWSTGTACPWRGPSRWRSGCRSSACPRSSMWSMR